MAQETVNSTTVLDPEELRQLDTYWRASLYLCVGMIYLRDNPLLRQPLRMEHIKSRLLGQLGFRSRPDLYLGAPEPYDQEV